jgi:hypothetical protein
MDTIHTNLYTLNIDIQKNKEIYAHLNGLSCTCDYCTNYINGFEKISIPQLEALSISLGIDWLKPDETIEYPLEDNTHQYQGIYYCVGSVVEGRGDEKLSENISFTFEDGIHGPQPRDIFSLHSPLMTCTLHIYNFPWVLSNE